MGHSLQAILFTLPFALLGAPVHGFTFTMGAFLHREGSDFVTKMDRRGLSYAVRNFPKDGLFDFLAPAISSLATIAVVYLLGGGL